MSRVIVVGGGAAGMMAAVAAAEKGHRVRLFEKNEKTGKKLFITGKGRCNVTNACGTEELFGSVLGNPKFLYSAFYGFSNARAMEFFEDAGCPLKTERGERVFPVSDRSSDVIAALNRKMKRAGVDVCLNAEVKEILTEASDGGPLRASGVRLAGGGEARGEAVIVATGGISYPSTGSTGDGYRFASRTGHALTDRRPSLVPLEVREGWCGELMGLSLKNVNLDLALDGKKLFSGFGEMLFTHFGVSGPLVLSASCHYVRKAWGQEAQMGIDLKPALNEEQLDRRLLREFEANGSRQFGNALDGLFPKRLVPVMVRLSGIEPGRRARDITKEERRRFLTLIKRLPLTVSGCRGFGEAVVTKGGVDVRDINPSTMESKRVAGLYFAGEVLDLDALTGGFNLQIAWSTGRLAGESVE